MPWRARPALAAAARELSPAETRTLLAVGRVVLPRSLGQEKADAIVGRFQAWLKSYREGADRGHGYGVARLNTAPGSPAANYPVQLAALAQAGFEARTPEDRRALLEAALRAAKVERLPERPDGAHVSSDLMAFFYRSSEANDLCYRAEIGKDTCRGLAGSEKAPKPSAGS